MAFEIEGNCGVRGSGLQGFEVPLLQGLVLRGFHGLVLGATQAVATGGFGLKQEDQNVVPACLVPKWGHKRAVFIRCTHDDYSKSQSSMEEVFSIQAGVT